MDNSASAVVDEQHQTITSASIATKSKKKSKNKKHSNGKNSINENNRVSEELLNNNGGSTLGTTEIDKSHTIGTFNGLSNNFDEKLQLHDLKCNKQNGTVEVEEKNGVKSTEISPLETNTDKIIIQPSSVATENGYHIPSDASEGQTLANGNCLTTVDTKSNKLKMKLSNKYRNKEAAEHCLKNVDTTNKETNMENGLHYCDSPYLEEQNHENKIDAHVSGNDCQHPRLNVDGAIAQEMSTVLSTHETASNDNRDDRISTATKNNDTKITEITSLNDKNDGTVATSQSTCAELTTALTTTPALDLSNVHIEYKEYESELQMHDIMRLIQAELSEPYSIYTYRYFIYNWPKLCFLATHGNEYVGAIVCKLDMHVNVMRGYIAMLAVRKEYRKLRIGTTLVEKAIEAMLADNADEVVLETEMRNVPALRLYENLGFVRDKRLFRYYLNGVDALRLKLWFR